ncbi:MAG: hypothetical protein ABSH11_11230 [Verrucomicrobiota bacterium]|jgi:hypothetical protein
MNALICIGCNVYQFLTTLNGAEKDATDIFNLLSRRNEEYKPESSQLLLSPNNEGIRAGFNAAFPDGSQIDVLTIFFAGHAGIKGGSFYLCSSDSDPERLSTTAFPIIDLFSMINEFHPKQVNVVVDACQSGGASFDLNQLLKPEIVGSSEGTSITFLGACSSGQLAGETRNGGVLTSELVKCLTGETEVQIKWPFLDLVDIGGVVSREVQRNNANQKPITWGLNLFGNGRFASNPHFGLIGNEPHFPFDDLTGTVIGRRVQLKSSALWNECRAIQEAFDPRRLLDLLENVFRETGDNREEVIPFVRVLANTLNAKAKESAELLAPSQCLATCALFLLPSIHTDPARSCVRDMFREIVASDLKSWNDLMLELGTDRFALLNNVNPVAELYYLPLRLTKTLGWLGLSTIIGKLLPLLADGNDNVRFKLAERIVERYETSFVTMSDEQAPFLYVFLKACLLVKKDDLARRVANLYFSSFAEKTGNVARVNTDGRTALQYLLSLGPETIRPADWRPANPSSLLSVLLLFGSKLGFESIWDLRALDRKSSNFYIPENHLDFGKKVIEGGINYTHRIGFGVWNVVDFNREFERGLQASFHSNLSNLPKEGAALCTVASLLFPDRLPLLLELLL